MYQFPEMWLHGKNIQKETEIISALKEKPLHIEKIAEDLGKQVFEITPTLTVLEIKGVIYKEDVNTYGLARNSEA